jgi:hypothetical protein
MRHSAPIGVQISHRFTLALNEFFQVAAEWKFRLARQIVERGNNMDHAVSVPSDVVDFLDGVHVHCPDRNSQVALANKSILSPIPYCALVLDTAPPTLGKCARKALLIAYVWLNTADTKRRAYPIFPF